MPVVLTVAMFTRLCNLKCFFEGEGNGEKAEEFPTIGANVDSILAVQCNWCCVQKFIERLVELAINWQELIEFHLSDLICCSYGLPLASESLLGFHRRAPYNL